MTITFRPTLRLTARVAPLLAVVAGVSTALAADHLDAPTVKMDATTDITDLYTFMDGNNVVFVLNVSPLATTTSKFGVSTAVQYAIHTTSTDKFVGGVTPVPIDIIATFDANQKISLWVGTSEYVTGDASATTGLASADGKVKVFAGLRDDPFFFNLNGFHDAEAAVEAAAGGLTFDAAGCPALNAATAAAVAGMLNHTMQGTMPTSDFFAGKNVLSIVVSVDKSLVTAGGALIASWASTNKGM
jgi:hypothetical protein